MTGSSGRAEGENPLTRSWEQLPLSGSIDDNSLLDDGEKVRLFKDLFGSYNDLCGVDQDHTKQALRSQTLAWIVEQASKTDKGVEGLHRVIDEMSGARELLEKSKEAASSALSKVMLRDPISHPQGAKRKRLKSSLSLKIHKILNKKVSDTYKEYLLDKMDGLTDESAKKNVQASIDMWNEFDTTKKLLEDLGLSAPMGGISESDLPYWYDDSLN